MIVYLKNNEIELETALSPIEFASLVDIQIRGDIHCSIAVTRGERCGFIPIDDIDCERSMKALENTDQLPLVLL